MKAIHYSFRAIGCIFAGIAIQAVAHADVLVGYSFDNAADLTSMLQPTSNDVNLTATSITANNTTAAAQFAFSTPDNELAVSPEFNAFAQSSISIPQTLTNATYVTFTLTPDVGQEMSFSNITLSAKTGGSTPPRAFYMFSSASGFTEPDILGSGVYEMTGTDTLTTSFSNYDISLAGSEFQNISTGTEFRIYMQSANSAHTVVFDDVVLNGSVTAIPEPSRVAFAISGLVLLGAVVRRRSAK